MTAKIRLLKVCFYVSLVMICGDNSWGEAQNSISGPPSFLSLTDTGGDYSLGTPIGTYLDILADPDGRFSISDVVTGKAASTFTRSLQAVPNYGISSAVYWMRFPVVNQSEFITEWLLELQNSNIQRIDVYFVAEGSIRQQKTTGTLFPFARRDVDYRNFVFTLTLPPGEPTTLYLRVRSEGPKEFPLAIWDSMSFARHIHKSSVLFGMFYGILIVMTLYNSFIFLSVRERSYFWYVLFLVFVLLSHAGRYGYSYAWFWPNSSWWTRHSIPFFGAAAFLMVIPFSISFLRTKSHTPRLHKLLVGTALLFLVDSVLAFIAIPASLKLMVPAALLLTGTIILAAIQCVRKGHQPARFYLAAWIFYLIGFVVLVLRIAGLTPHHIFLTYMTEAGNILQCILLSLALADRINQEREAKLAAQQRLTHKLETQVAERTMELSQARQHAEDAREKAETANRAKSVFLANMSHELRTPLNAILGFAQLIARNSSVPDEELENLNVIRRSGDHLLALIDHVLDLSKIEAGRITLNVHTMDLHELLSEIENMFRLRIEQKGLSLTVTRMPGLPRYLHGDDVKLRQVLLNVLHNAVKFTEKGGIRVSVRSEQLSEPARQFGSGTRGANTGYRVFFTVEDTGPGIAPSEIDAAFEPFGQTESGRQAHEGSGLGLSISRKFARLMGGDLTMTSQPGQGTTLYMSFQAALAEVPTEMERRSDAFPSPIALEAGQPECRILIVDDIADNRVLLLKLLSPFGFQLREAERGNDAIEIWRTWKPQLIWLDLRMPGLSGYDVAQTIRREEAALPQDEHTAILAMSASALKEERTVALSNGCDEFLQKPLLESEIFEGLQKYLKLRFVYENEHIHAPASPKKNRQQTEMTLIGLRALPPELLLRLEESLTICDIARIENVLAEIHKLNAPLAEDLGQLAHDFKYTTILGLIEEGHE